MFHTSTMALLPSFEVVEANYVPNWACVDWKFYGEILSHILFFKMKQNKKFTKVVISLNFHSISENTTNYSQQENETQWGYLVTKIIF